MEEVSWENVIFSTSLAYIMKGDNLKNCRWNIIRLYYPHFTGNKSETYSNQKLHNAQIVRQKLFFFSWHKRTSRDFIKHYLYLTRENKKEKKTKKPATKQK